MDAHEKKEEHQPLLVKRFVPASRPVRISSSNVPEQSKSVPDILSHD